MDDPYVVEWGLDGTGYLRRTSLLEPTPPTPPPEPPLTEEDADGSDDPWAYGRTAGTPGR